LEQKQWIPKITDFGMSKVVDRKSNTFSYAGTPIYDAPELWTLGFKKEGYDNRVGSPLI
jgi:serine/threonine protein kinase